MEEKQVYFEKKFQQLIDEMSMMINSGILREEEIIKFYGYIQVLSDDVFDFETKLKYSVIIEDIVKKYRDVIIVEQEYKFSKKYSK